MGAVFEERHKLDDKIYAVKVVRIQVPCKVEGEGCCSSVGDLLMSHPAMKEISAISKLSHKNIVGYKGCWVEAEEPPPERIKKIMKKLQRRQKSWLDKSEISEEEEDPDPDQVFRTEQKKKNEGILNGDNILLADLGLSGDYDLSNYNSDRSLSISEYDEEEDYDSECASDCTFYDLCEKRTSFAQLSVMIQMEYAGGVTLNKYIEQCENGMQREEVFQMFM
jgi:hypothetical protein